MTDHLIPPTTPSESTAVPILEAVGVSKTFGGIQALHDVDVVVVAGEIHALVGENGAGKSTLIKVLTGVHAPDAGDVRLGGEPVRFTRPADAQTAGISTIYQEVNLVPLLSVARNIFMGREPRTRWGLIDVRAMERQAADLVRHLGIEVDVTEELGRLGLGTQQMVALARAMSVDARIVIMDEPTSSLEAREVAVLFDVARTLRDQGVSLIFVSHRLDELWQLCDRVTILRDGRHVHTGEMADIDRLGLVSLMLGRDAADVADTGATDFGKSHAQSSVPVLSVSGIQVRNRLHDIGLDVCPGEVLGLAGLLGSGRSETVKAIYGALRTQGGQVSVDGTPVRSNSVRAALKAGIAMLSEDRKVEGIVAELSVRDNIALAVLGRESRFGLVREDRLDDLVATFMERLHIKASSPHQPVRELSGGNQQKVLIARWLCTQPKVFLLDEPTRGIDVGAIAEVQGVIDELAEQGRAVILISSEMDELVEGANRIVVLSDGEVDTVLEGNLTASALLTALAGDVARADAELEPGSVIDHV